MANEKHVEQLGQGVEAWNEWRKENPGLRVDLSKVDLHKANLDNANLNGANLREANLYRAALRKVDLSKADLYKATLNEASLREANLSGANLEEAQLYFATLGWANLSQANLRKAYLWDADLREANLYSANLHGANLSKARLWNANISKANLYSAILLETDFKDADLTGCRIYGVSAWGLKLEGAKQQNLIITDQNKPNQPEITVDDIEVAQFIYLLLHNQKIRNVIDTITTKVVLILGRFTEERKKVLDAIREELREHDYVPILFDFDKPASQDLTATVSTLAHMARFIIADVTDPSSIPHELATIVPTTPVPVQPILLSGQSEFAMFVDLRRRYSWVLPTHRYDTQEQLIANLSEAVIHPAERKVEELRKPILE